MTDRELKKFAFTGILIRIKAEQQKLNNEYIDEANKQRIEKQIEKLQQYANEILEELRNDV